MDASFKSFDKDADLSINEGEWKTLLKALFRNAQGIPYPIDDYLASDLFYIFNKGGDGSMSKEEYHFCWNNWIKKIVRPVSAILVVDVQNDFISGTLSISNCPAGQNGEDVVAPINKMIDNVPFDEFFYSLDWHPADHISFFENVHTRELDVDSNVQDPTKANVFDLVVFKGPPKTEQILWPAHCIQESWGADFHKDLKMHPKAVVVKKGCTPYIDSYSAFFDNKKLGKTELEDLLRSKGVTDVYCCGIAYDVCVASTAFHAQELGFRTVLVDDASKGINDDGIAGTITKIKENHGCVVDSTEVKPMVTGRDRRVELGYQLAIQCRNQIINMPGGGYPLKNRNSKYNIPIEEKLAKEEQEAKEAKEKAEAEAANSEKKAEENGNEDEPKDEAVPTEE